MLGLLAATIVVLFGVALAGWTKTERLADVAPQNGVIPLYALSAPADLEPALTMFDSPRERQRVARAVYERAKAADPIDHVGALAGVGSLSRANLQALKPRLAVRSVEQYRRGLAGSVALFIGAFWIVHLFRRWRGRDDDALLLPALMLLCGIGLMTMCALRDPIRDTMTVSVFAGGVALGLVLLVAASEIDFESSPLRRAVVLPLGLACLLATLLLVLGSGPGSSGVKVNLFGVQPVEAVRLLVVFALAAYFGRRVELLRELVRAARSIAPMAPVRQAAEMARRPSGAGRHGARAHLLFPAEGFSDRRSSCRAFPRPVRDRARTSLARRRRFRDRCSPVSPPRTGPASAAPCAIA
jgi:hypothetical protein